MIMAISVNQLLIKMENELHKAKSAQGTSQLRENVHSIKVLCELILEENQSGVTSNLAGTKTSPAVSRQAPTVVPVTSLTTKKLVEEEANGDSLFDF
jgi:hypothetical protein